MCYLHLTRFCMGKQAGISNPTDTEAVLESVSQHEFPQSIHPVLDSYDELIGDRDRLFWHWIDDLFPSFALSSVAPSHREDTRLAKLLISMFVTVLDDVAEKHDDRATFEAAANIPYDQGSEAIPPAADEAVVAFAEDLWTRFEEHAAGPRTAEFDDLLRFDLRQVIEAIHYSYLLNHHLNILSEDELWAHDVHNMAVFVYADIDLIASPEFDAAELSRVRRVVRRTERIARICNWIATWERELHEGDCSSGVIAYALDSEIVSLDELKAIRANPSDTTVIPVVEAIRDHDVETVFSDRLEDEFTVAEELGRTVTSVDTDGYLAGFEEVWKYHAALKEMR